jgi:hypothetical protein
MLYQTPPSSRIQLRRRPCRPEEADSTKPRSPHSALQTQYLGPRRAPSMSPHGGMLNQVLDAGVNARADRPISGEPESSRIGCDEVDPIVESRFPIVRKQPASTAQELAGKLGDSKPAPSARTPGLSNRSSCPADYSSGVVGFAGR